MNWTNWLPYEGLYGKGAGVSRERINKIVFDELSLEVYFNEPSDLTEFMTIEGDLGADSLEIISLVTALEMAYDVEIGDEFMEWETVGDIYNGFITPIFSRGTRRRPTEPKE